MGIFKTSHNARLYDLILLILRITVGCFMITHGLAKLPMLMADGPIQFADPIGLGPSASLALVVFAEVICSFLIIIGLATRLAVVPLIITMFVVLFVVHGSEGFGKQELPGLYMIIYILLLVTGSGKFSVDQMIEGRSRKVNY